ncbi:uncharacterized protein [Asterias amurensis]|uniref:uncharacterized protein n=1 Tax=Asterias amurensis TaxID=7602 RepID=UPI003AB66D50
MHVFCASCVAALSCHRLLLLVLLVMSCSLAARANFFPKTLNIRPTTTGRSKPPVRRFYLPNEVRDGSSTESPGSFYRVISPWDGRARKQRVQRTQTGESTSGDSTDSFALLMEEWASRNSISKSDAQAYVASVYGGSIQNKRKRMSGYSGTSHKTRRTGSRRRVYFPDSRQQVFEAMPPFKPPPSGTLLPDLFSNPRDAAVSSHNRPNTSSSVIAQRPPRPSSSNPGTVRRPGSNPGTVPRPGSNPGTVRRPSSNPETVPRPGSNPGAVPRPGASLGTVPRLDGKPRSPNNQDPRRSSQVLDAESLSFTGEEPGIPGIEPNGELEDTLQGTEGSMVEDVRQSVYGSLDGVFAGRPYPPIPPNGYKGLPSPETDNPQIPGSPTTFNPRDVKVTIETRRLQLTYSVNAPPYLTFESLLSQLATFLMPGFCVDLAVTRRDEQCDIISHMAALKTDRLQNWQIEITDTRGKIIWFNQCMPDSRLFIVPGFTVSFKFTSHLQQPVAKSTAEAQRVDLAEQASHPPPIHADDSQPLTSASLQ